MRVQEILKSNERESGHGMELFKSARESVRVHVSSRPNNSVRDSRRELKPLFGSV